jgi:nitrous oxide reductase accessory protein NosL
MLKKAVKFSLVCAFVLFLVSSAFSEPMSIPEGATCYECGMEVDVNSPFSAQMIVGGKLRAFCDIGDMLYHYNKMKEKPDMLYVRDYATGAWIDALKASYVKSKKFKTPMDWGIAAFKEKDAALKAGNALSFEEALKIVK